MLYNQVNPNIMLSLLEENDAEILFDLVTANKAFLSNWLRFPSVTNHVEDSKSFIKKSLFRFVNKEGFWVGIWYKEKLAGCIGFLYFDWNVKKTEIGYWLGEAYTNKGIMTDTCAAMVDYAFHELEINKVEIKTAVKNIKSAAVPKKLGFKHEGTIRADERIRDTFHDREVYGMLREEWRNGNWRN
ncbi:GNAT family N-acetyltransferase [Oceanobacillus jeddahense]|uniref:GNAT family N-acetyltransferase n=1 Tax=Oceanobacillus jeddahense TaxID=1462527 RepID=A0ABY5JXS3_9BACI|nr:GNAT family protein [Oceanobacillus jeddahense]UUI05188.1 GNAT family N-acetyltransferase [Oceanobacillus jeddahense]